MPALRALSAASVGLLTVVVLAGAPAHAAATTGEIVGQVLDRGRPVAGTTVDIPHGYGPPIVTAAVTDATGRFRLTAVPAGTTNVMFILPGGGMTQYYGDVTDIQAATLVTVTAGRTTRIVEHVVPHGGLHGRLRKNDGTPAAGAQVGTSLTRPVVNTTTDAHGDWALDYLLAGNYWVFSRMASDAPVQFWPRKESIFEGTQITVTDGTRERVDERLLPVGAIAGTYRTPDGPLLATIEANADRAMSTLPSLTDGSYTLWLRPGDYKLFFDTDGTQDQWASAVLTEAEAEVFHVRDGQTIRHDERSVPYGTVTGRILDYLGNPIPVPVTVTIQNASGLAQGTTVADADGNWSVAVFPGTYTVQYYWQDGLTQNGAAPVVVPSGGTVFAGEERFRPNTTIAVEATLNGDPVTGFCATLDSRQCTDQGYILFEYYKPGPYVVTVEIPGHAPKQLPVTVVLDQTVGVTAAFTD